MRQILIQEDVKLVEEKLKSFESKTGCDLLLVVAQASDPYPAASLRFGIIGGLIMSLIFSHYYEFHQAYFWPLSFFGLILLMTWIGHFPWAKSLALSNWEKDRECKEKAIELFHTLGTSKVSHKVTAMIMLSSLEKRIEVVVDEKLKSKLDQAHLDSLISVMQKHFKEGNVGLGLINSIESLQEKILISFNGKVSDSHSSELSDTIHFI